MFEPASKSMPAIDYVSIVHVGLQGPARDGPWRAGLRHRRRRLRLQDGISMPLGDRRAPSSLIGVAAASST